MEKKLSQLYDLKRMIESEEFQAYVMKPLKKELDALKHAYECKTLTELATVKGKYYGLSFMAKLVERIDLDIKNTRHDLESQG